MRLFQNVARCRTKKQFDTGAILGRPEESRAPTHFSEAPYFACVRGQSRTDVGPGKNPTLCVVGYVMGMHRARFVWQCKTHACVQLALEGDLDKHDVSSSGRSAEVSDKCGSVG